MNNLIKKLLKEAEDYNKMSEEQLDQLAASYNIFFEEVWGEGETFNRKKSFNGWDSVRYDKDEDGDNIMKKIKFYYTYLPNGKFIPSRAKNRNFVDYKRMMLQSPSLKYFMKD